MGPEVEMAAMDDDVGGLERQDEVMTRLPFSTLKSLKFTGAFLPTNHGRHVLASQWHVTYHGGNQGLTH
jgi:hypothetical protein